MFLDPRFRVFWILERDLGFGVLSLSLPTSLPFTVSFFLNPMCKEQSLQMFLNPQMLLKNEVATLEIVPKRGSANH
jgi:hypothetical protein